MLEAIITPQAGQIKATVVARSMGTAGPAGPEGPEGPQGQPGPQGDPGDPGSGGGALWCGPDLGSNGLDIVLAPETPLTGEWYEDGQTVLFRVTRNLVALDSVASMNVSGLGATDFNRADGSHMSVGDLRVGEMVQAVFDANTNSFRQSSPMNTSFAGTFNVNASSRFSLNGVPGTFADMSDSLLHGPVVGADLHAGGVYSLRFTETIVLVHSSSFQLLNSGADMTMEAGDFAVFQGYPGGVVRMSSFARA